MGIRKKTVTVCTCDRCGFEWEQSGDHVEVRQIHLMFNDDTRPDLLCPITVCQSCYDEFRNLTVHHYMDWDFERGKARIKNAPYAEILDLELRNEELQKDVAELEMELERLAELKDNLFETNIKLTDMLHGFGVAVDGKF